MADTLTRADVERIAALARLQIADEDVDRFARQMTAILAYADQVQRVDTSGVQPMASTAADTVWRDDHLVPSLDRDRLLEQAPAADRTAGLFKVPRVIGS